MTIRIYHGILLVMTTMSDRVREAIKTSGLTRYQIAKQSGVTEGALSRFVAGERDMTLRTLERIAPLIGVRLTVSRPRRRQKGR